MSLLDFLSGLFGHSDSSLHDSIRVESHEAGITSHSGIGIGDHRPAIGAESIAINPASGLPMVGGEGGVDVSGNPYGVDDSQSGSCPTLGDDIGSSFDSGSIGCGGGLDDW
jgi:hypothetical protein